MTSGISFNDYDWNRYNGQLMAGVPRRSSYQTVQGDGTTNGINSLQTDTFTSSITGDVGSSNFCTDGKDDGKISICGVLGNITQGVVRGAVGMVKGAFTNSEGKFSLLKTAATVVLGAACVAVPALGLAACAVGVVTGGAKVIKNTATALSAKTDAEAKEAWENVGSGGLTVALSAVGAKASYNAVQASAGGANSAMANLASKTGQEGFFANLKSSPMQTIKALGKDMVTSSKNGFNGVKQAFANWKEGTSDYNKLIKMEKTKANAELKLAKNEALTSEEQAAIDAWNNLDPTQYSAKALEKVSAKNTINYYKSELHAAAKTGDKAVIKTAKAGLKEAKSTYFKTTPFGKAVKTVSSTAKSATENTRAALELIKSGDKTGILQAIKRINPENLGILKAGMHKDALAIFQALTEENASYTALINQYGYNNVLSVLETVLATDNLNQNI